MIFFLDKKLYKEKDGNILVYDISHKTSMNTKSFHIRFNKTVGFIKTHNGIRCLVLIDNGWFYKIYDGIKYLTIEKSKLIHIIVYILKKYWVFIML